jgi:LacI family transcriptional regulator
MPGHRPSHRVTIAEVARQAGVSTATVSRVLNRTGSFSEETAAAVRSAVAELRYTPRAAAQSLARGRTNTLGLLLPEIGGAFFAPLVRGIEAAAREAGFDLLIYATEPASGRGADFSRRLGARNTDGLLVFTGSLDGAELVHLHEQGFPMVLLLQPPPENTAIPCVSFQNKSGARRIVDHLIEVHGCRRIAFLRGPEGHTDSSWREQGYRESLAAHGIPFDVALVATGGFDEEEAQAPVEDWLRQNVQLDAIFAGDDESAYGALQVLQRWGKRVPGEIALAGFDDIYFAQYLSPPLTTVRAPIEMAGRLATERLLSIVDGGETTAPEILLPTELVIRESCGCLGPRLSMGA